MAIAQITGQGLSAIAVLVVLLWGCLVGERVIVRRANVEAARTLREIRALRLKRHLIPVSAPQAPRPVRPSVG